MQVTFTGHDFTITEALKTHTQAKFEKVHHHFAHMVSAHVTLKKDKLDHVAEITVSVPQRHELHASAKNPDMYVAINHMMEEIDRQLKKVKDKMKDHHA